MGHIFSFLIPPEVTRQKYDVLSYIGRAAFLWNTADQNKMTCIPSDGVMNTS
jgi:hypothetical protein